MLLAILRSSFEHVFVLLAQDGCGHAAVDIRSFLEGVYKVLVPGERSQDPYLYLGEITHHQLVAFGSNNGLTQLTFGGDALQRGISTAHPARVGLALSPARVDPPTFEPLVESLAELGGLILYLVEALEVAGQGMGYLFECVLVGEGLAFLGRG